MDPTEEDAFLSDGGAFGCGGRRDVPRGDGGAGCSTTSSEQSSPRRVCRRSGGHEHLRRAALRPRQVSAEANSRAALCCVGSVTTNQSTICTPRKNRQRQRYSQTTETQLFLKFLPDGQLLNSRRETVVADPYRGPTCCTIEFASFVLLSGVPDVSMCRTDIICGRKVLAQNVWSTTPNMAGEKT